MKEEEQNQEMIVLEERVKQDLAQIAQELPKFEDLSEQEQKKVREYMESLDVNDIRSINKYGKQVFEDSSQEQEAYLSTLKNGELEIGEIESELLQAFDTQKTNQNLIEKILSFGKKKIQSAENKQRSVTETTELLAQKEEKLRNELEQHYYRLQQMAQSSAKERREIELLIVAAKEKFEEIKKRIEELEKKQDKSFEEIQEVVNLKGYLIKLARKIEGDETRLITTTSRALTATYLAQGVDEAAFCFEQDMELARPEIRATAIFSKSRQIVTGAVDTYEAFQKNMNAMVAEESKKSLETLEKIKQMSQNPLLNEETLKEICKNTIEASKLVREYHESQNKTTTIGSKYSSMYENFTKELQEAIGVESGMQPTSSYKIDGENQPTIGSKEER